VDVLDTIDWRGRLALAGYFNTATLTAARLSVIGWACHCDGKALLALAEMRARHARKIEDAY